MGDRLTEIGPGNEQAALEADWASQIADDDQRTGGLRTLEGLKQDHPHHSVHLDRLITRLKEKPTQEGGDKNQETATN